MRTETVEIYSDASNAAVMRHPGRRFPGVLVQGDTMHTLHALAQRVCAAIGRDGPGFDDADDLRDHLQSFVTHYKNVLAAHDIALPFFESDNPKSL